jgi:putative endopeptidase
MGPQTKQEALAKLDNMRLKVGYPNKWRDYSGLEITTDSYVMNVLNSQAFEFRYTMNKVGKPVDREEWGMTPQTVNAGYFPNKNEIIFPAGILQPPFFNLDADEAVNYGAIGMVIGHEMTHGFDNRGRQFDKDGNLRDWWTKDDTKAFEDRAAMLIDQYNHLEVSVVQQYHLMPTNCLSQVKKHPSLSMVLLILSASSCHMLRSGELICAMRN